MRGVRRTGVAYRRGSAVRAHRQAAHHHHPRPAQRRRGLAMGRPRVDLPQTVQDAARLQRPPQERPRNRHRPVLKGYDPADLTEVFTRYMPPPVADIVATLPNGSSYLYSPDGKPGSRTKQRLCRRIRLLTHTRGRDQSRRPATWAVGSFPIDLQRRAAHLLSAHRDVLGLHGVDVALATVRAAWSAVPWERRGGRSIAHSSPGSTWMPTRTVRTSLRIVSWRRSLRWSTSLASRAKVPCGERVDHRGDSRARVPCRTTRRTGSSGAGR